MKNITICVLDKTHTLANELGKKGTQTDLLMTHKKIEDVWYTFIDPIQYPEKIKGVYKALNISNIILINIDEIDKHLGELILAAHSSNKKGILFSNIFSKEDIQSFIEKTNLKNWELVNEIDISKIENLVKELTQEEKNAKQETEISIDQAFPVKGIGAVILGNVLNGEIKVHDTIKLFPSNTIAEVRSIQVHDTDVKQAETGDRVGLALKNVDVEKIKGDELIILKDNNGWELKKDKIEIKFNQDLIKTEIPQVIYLSYLLCEINAKVEKTENNILTIYSEKPFIYKKGVKGFIYQLDKTPRFIGTFEF
ncbi:hypothetical protein KO317_03910 [Candidatus Micrarchaeota archaeon]|nr:hypothetical protein [Candidatus Micrarchaeota archaeon]